MIKNTPLLSSLIIFITISFVNANWPTWRANNERSAISYEAASKALNLKWIYSSRHKPLPLKSSENRIIWDKCYYPVASQGKVIFGSSADGAIYCLDSETGKENWRFITEGAIRFAPSVKESSVVVGSDDGYVYCLNLKNGNLNWKYSFNQKNSRKIASNGRIVSSNAIRTGVIIENENVYFGCGLFQPMEEMGTRSICLNLQDGTEVFNNKSYVYAYGYLRKDGNRIECPERGMDNSEITSTNEIIIGNVSFKGGDGFVTGGNFYSKINGTASALIYSDKKLFVSTNLGQIYCFGIENEVPIIHQSKNDKLPYLNRAIRDQFDDAADKILNGANLGENTKGYALIIDGEYGELAIALAKKSDLQIICLENENNKFNEAQNNVNEAGVGNQVTVQYANDYSNLDYASHMFNIISYNGFATNNSFIGDKSELRRLLRPYGGVAYLDDDTIKYGNVVGAGQWTHDRANPSNNPNSYDKYVSEDLELQWHGDPGPDKMIDRHNKAKAPLFCNGILFVSGDDYFWGIDAYNGTILWEREIENTVRPITPYRDVSHFAATSDRLYITQGNQLLGLDPRTGKEISRFTVPNIGWDWGYVAIVGDILFGSAEKNPTSEKLWATSGYLFAMDRHSGNILWQYNPEAAIVNLSLCIGNEKIYFLAAGNNTTQNNADPGFGMFSDKATEITALNINTGSKVWTKQCDFSSFYHSVYMIYSQKHDLVIVDGVPEGKVSFTIQAWDGKDGSEVWGPVNLKTDDDYFNHWNHEAAPVVSGDSLHILSFDWKVSVNVLTGQGNSVYWFNVKGGHGCSNFSATETNLFHRGWNPMAFNVTDNINNKITTQSRSGCNINLIPAGGLLCMPEASSGCNCSFQKVESFAWRSSKKLEIEENGMVAKNIQKLNNSSLKTNKLKMMISQNSNLIKLDIRNVEVKKNVKITFLSVNGRTIKNEIVNSKNKNFTYDLKFNNLSTGMYFITIENGSQKCTCKLMIIK